MTPSTTTKRASTRAPNASKNGHDPDDAQAVADANAAASKLPYRFAVVPLKHLVVDAYQRPLTNFVTKIERNFDPALVGTLCLSERSATKFAVIDGQTRAEAMRRIGLTEAPAIVYSGLTTAQEAALFAKFQTERRGMTSASRFQAEVIAGVPTAVAINEVIEGLGFFVDHNSTEPGSLRAVAALEYVYRGARDRKASTKPNAELLALTLETLKSAWPKLPDTAKSASMIRGLGYFLGHHENIDNDRLVARLSKVTPSELAKRAEALREGHGMSGSSPVYMAEAIQAQYRRR